MLILFEIHRVMKVSTFDGDPNLSILVSPLFTDIDVNGLLIFSLRHSQSTYALKGRGT